MLAESVIGLCMPQDTFCIHADTEVNIYKHLFACCISMSIAAPVRCGAAGGCSHASPQTAAVTRPSHGGEETRSGIHYSYNLPSLTSSPLKLPLPTTLHSVVSVMMGLMVYLARAHRKLQQNKYCQVSPPFHPELIYFGLV